MSKDEYYSSNISRLDTIIGGDQSHLAQLIVAREEFSKIHNTAVYIPWERFYTWLEDEYGVCMKMTAGGMLELDYTVVDEKKYLLFVLKFSGNA